MYERTETFCFLLLIFQEFSEGSEP